MHMAKNATSQERKRYPPLYLDCAELRRRRLAAGMTQDALARRVDSTQNRLAHLEADEGCGIELIIALADELKCKPTDLMHAEGRTRYAALVEALGGKAA
jgi:transcriptional regulator with XRE-family HTH domain